MRVCDCMFVEKLVHNSLSVSQSTSIFVLVCEEFEHIGGDVVVCEFVYVL